MAVPFGEMLAGAGRIGRRGEQVGQELRNYERDRIALDELRRQQALQAEISQRGLASRMAGEAPPMAGMTPGLQFGTPPAPAPVAVATPVATGYLGRGDVIPPLVGQPQPTYPPVGVPLNQPYQDPAGYTPPAGLSGPEQMRRLQEARLSRFADPRQTAQDDAAMRAYREAVQPAPVDARSGRTGEPMPSTAAAPMDFNRLAAAVEQVESGGREDAVSPKGALGPMQTMPGTLRDPGFGVRPAQDDSVAEQRRVGQDYLQAMLQKYGGNLDHALAAYNWGPSNTDRWIAAGADPAKLPKETREYIPRVRAAMGDTAAVASAAPAISITEQTSPTVAADEVAKAATYGTMYGEDIVDASPNNPQIQRVLTERQALVEKIQLMEQYGFGTQALELVPLIRGIDLGLFKAQADQGIYEGEMTGNFSRAMTALSYFRQQPHQVLQRSDGGYDLYVGGKVARTNVSKNELADLIKTNLDESYRAQKAELAGEAYKSQLKVQEIVTKEVLNAQGNLQVALANIQGRLAELNIKGQQPKITVDTNQGVLWVQRGNDVFYVNPRGETVTVRGKTLDLPTTTRVPGLQ